MLFAVLVCYILFACFLSFFVIILLLLICNLVATYNPQGTSPSPIGYTSALTSEATLPLHTFSQVAIVRKGLTMSIYINGVLDTSVITRVLFFIVILLF